MLKFLIPVDGSEPSEQAVKELLRYLSWIEPEVEIHLLNVQPSVPYGRRVSAVVGHSRLKAYQQEDGLAALKPARTLLDKAGVRYKFSVGTGDAAEAIIRYANEQSCDQILMATQGMGSLAGLVMGSVATKVVHLSPVPVLLTRKRGAASRSKARTSS
jgi:nucleotide-binding universal stress UspA family protein